MIQAKSLFQSKTFWVAVIQAVIAVIVVFSTNYPSIGWFLAAKSILDVVLRLATTQPIASPNV